MTFKEFFLIKESKSILYHYTNSLNDILTSNTFELSNALLSNSESRFLPEGNKKPYFMSFARNRSGEYRGGELLVIDGDKLSHRYRLIPTNYYGSRMGFSNEMEERLWSSEPFIKNAISYIKEIHLYVPEESLKDDKNPLISSRIPYLKIPVYIYTSRKDLFLMNKKKALEIKDWSEYPTKFSYSGSQERDLELIEFLETGKPKGKRRFLDYQYYPRDFVDSIAANIHNMRSQRSIFYRELSRRLTNLFRKYNSTDINDFLKKAYNDIFKSDYFKT